MIFQGLLLASSGFWLPISAPVDTGSQTDLQASTQLFQALVCPVQQLESCLTQLPSKAQLQLPHIARLQQEIGLRGAMAKPIDVGVIKGLILIDVDNIPQTNSILIDGKVYSLPLQQALEMTLLHELGHLVINSSNSRYLSQANLTVYQHEWLADFYLLWMLAKQGQSIGLAWQQLHRRNIGVFESVDAMSHWSSPMLVQLLECYSWQTLGEFDSFDDLIDVIYPQLQQYSQGELNEYASLLKHLFSRGIQQSLPNYMFWRRAAMGRYIKPTIDQLLGREAAELWLTEHKLLVKQKVEVN